MIFHLLNLVATKADLYKISKKLSEKQQWILPRPIVIWDAKLENSRKLSAQV